VQYLNTTGIRKIIYGWIAGSLSSTNNQLPADVNKFVGNLPYILAVDQEPNLVTLLAHFASRVDLSNLCQS
jgi:hypothetical protein